MAALSEHSKRAIERAELSLDGLSLGDAFGECFFSSRHVIMQQLASRELPEAPWFHTDDTAMAVAVFQTLAEAGRIDQDMLAAKLVAAYANDPYRGYGKKAHSIFRRLGDGGSWRDANGEAPCDIEGAMSNGEAVRAALVGAYFSDEPQKAVEEARLSAEITHQHEEALAGAAAVSLAAAWAAANPGAPSASLDLLKFVADHTPKSQTREMIEEAIRVPFECSGITASGILGNGSQGAAQDTVPFALWCAARNLNDFPGLMWETVSALGDRDTNCAIAGGVVALSVGREGLPADWMISRESLPLEIQPR